LSYFIANVNRESFQTRHVLGKLIDAFIVLLFEDSRVGVSRGKAIAIASSSALNVAVATFVHVAVAAAVITSPCLSLMHWRK
jgi:hypothetical protein